MRFAMMLTVERHQRGDRQGRQYGEQAPALAYSQYLQTAVTECSLSITSACCPKRQSRLGRQKLEIDCNYVHYVSKHSRLSTGCIGVL